MEGMTDRAYEILAHYEALERRLNAENRKQQFREWAKAEEFRVATKQTRLVGLMGRL